MNVLDLGSRTSLPSITFVPTVKWVLSYDVSTYNMIFRDQRPPVIFYPGAHNE